MDFRGIVCRSADCINVLQDAIQWEHVAPYTFAANPVIRLATSTSSVTILLRGCNTYRHNFRRRFILDVNQLWHPSINIRLYEIN